MVTFYVGTYEKSGGRGLTPLSVAAGGACTTGEPFAGAANASFAVRGRGLVYLVDERDEGAINVLRARDGGWERVAQVATAGAAPCYVALDPGGTRLAAANYATGSVALFDLDAHGLPIAPPTVFQGSGSGPVADRQDGPHAHCVRFSSGGEELYWVDLGADRIGCLTLTPPSAGATFLQETTAWRAPPGIGPRHLLFHRSRPLALVLSELASTLTLLEMHEGRLRPRQTLSTLPTGFSGESLGGHLELSVDGTRAYASNRGHNSIAVFALEDERLELIQHVASGGAHPRHFAPLEGEGLAAIAHEKDGRVRLFGISADGTLAATGHGATVPGACYVLA
jgi:6-phosphogluconolactonase